MRGVDHSKPDVSAQPVSVQAGDTRFSTGPFEVNAVPCYSVHCKRRAPGCGESTEIVATSGCKVLTMLAHKPGHPEEKELDQLFARPQLGMARDQCKSSWRTAEISNGCPPPFIEAICTCLTSFVKVI